MTTAKVPIVGAVCLILMGGAAVVLHRLQHVQHLGRPGIRVVEVGVKDEKGDPASTNSLFLPEKVLDYRSTVEPITRVELDWLPQDTTFGRRRYQSGTDDFQVYVSGVLMGSDRTSIHKPEYCLPSQGFRILRRTQGYVRIHRPHPYDLPVTRIDALKQIRLPEGRVQEVGAVYVYWFVSESRLSNDHFERMWWLAVDLLRTGELQRWAYIGCLGLCAPGQQDAAFARVKSWVQAAVPEFQLTTGPVVAASSPSPAAQADRSREAGTAEGRLATSDPSPESPPEAVTLRPPRSD